MNKLLDKVFRGIDIFTGILTGAMVLFVFLNVVLRMVFNSGLTWSEELARYLFVAVTYIGAISGLDISFPPRALLGNFKQAANVDGLWTWIQEQAA